MTRSTVLTLPVPPSVNAAYRNRTSRDNPGARGRIKTPAYKAWEAEAHLEVMRQRPGRISGPVAIALKVARRSSQADIDNRIKPLVDFLVHASLIDDDRNVTAVSAEWAPRELGRCLVTITASDQADHEKSPTPGDVGLR